MGEKRRIGREKIEEIEARNKEGEDIKGGGKGI